MLKVYTSEMVQRPWGLWAVTRFALGCKDEVNTLTGRDSQRNSPRKGETAHEGKEVVYKLKRRQMCWFLDIRLLSFQNEEH